MYIFRQFTSGYSRLCAQLVNSIETLSNGIRAINIFFSGGHSSKNLCYMFFDFDGRWGSLSLDLPLCVIVIVLMTVLQ